MRCKNISNPKYRRKNEKNCVQISFNLGEFPYKFTLNKIKSNLSEVSVRRTFSEIPERGTSGFLALKLKKNSIFIIFYKKQVVLVVLAPKEGYFQSWENNISN